MPTISDPETKDAKPQLVTPEVKQPELFAAEIEMEGKSSNLFPIVFVTLLVLVVGGTIFYFVKGAKAVLTQPVATEAVNAIMKSQGDATVRFSTGLVTSNMNEKPTDPHYALLTKAGILETKKKSWDSITSAITPAGQKLLDGIPGVEKTTNPDKTVTYQVPLAQRELLAIEKVDMIRPHLARVTYSWQWKPNRLGKQFDASSELVKSFNTWDRGTLIKSYGVDFYSAAPTHVTIVLQETKDGSWKPYVE
ncbi:MAG: hypothetical protein WAM71_16365 [Candidatus Korobacteraceae bacterium]